MADAESRLMIAGPLPPPPGGVSLHVLREVSLLEGRGVECRCCRLGGWFPEGVGAGGVLRAAAGTLIASLRCLFGRQRAVHLHHSRWQYSLPVLLCARLSGRPYAVTAHSRGLLEELRSMPGPLSGMMRRLLSRASLLISVSGAVHEGLERAGATPERRIVLPAFLPPSDEELTGEGLEGEAAELYSGLRSRKGKLLLASAYNLGPGYGRDDVYGIELLSRALAADPPSQDLTLLVMVSRRLRSEQAESALARIRVTLRRTDRIRFEVLFGHPMAPFLALTDAYVRPSRIDGDSVALREALSMGVPSAASNEVDRPEGAMIFPLEEAAVSEAVRELLGSSSEGRKPTRGGDALADAMQYMLRTCKDI